MKGFNLTEGEKNRIKGLYEQTSTGQTTNIKQEYINEIRSLLDRMENSNEHNADTVAQIIVNNSNYFLTRQKQWSDQTKYGKPLFVDSEVKYLDKD